MKWCAEVDVQCLVEPVHRVVRDRTSRSDAGIQNEGVHRLEFVSMGLCNVFGGVSICQIGRHGHNALCTGCQKSFGYLAERFLVAGGDGQTVTQFCQARSDPEAYSA